MDFKRAVRVGQWFSVLADEMNFKSTPQGPITDILNDWKVWRIENCGITPIVFLVILVGQARGKSNLTRGRQSQNLKWFECLGLEI